jgi:uncharacterized protein YrzB (UPF0473 family)
VDYLSKKGYNIKIMSGSNFRKEEEEMEEEMEEKILLVDDDGVEKEFELVVSFDVGDKTYVLLSENEESDDVFPFYIANDDDGEVLLPVDNEAEFAIIEAAYDELMESEDEDESETE